MRPHRRVTGRVVGADGQGLAGWSVALAGTCENVAGVAVTDTEGEFHITSVDPRPRLVVLAAPEQEGVTGPKHVRSVPIDDLEPEQDEIELPTIVVEAR